MKKLISAILGVCILGSSVSMCAIANDNEVTNGLFEEYIASESIPSEWAAEEIEEAIKTGIITDAVKEDYLADITREEFCELAITAYEKMNDNPIATDGIKFTDTDNENILKAASVGIVNGYGDGIFAPNENITREQMITMLVRMIDKADIGVDITDYEETEFTDKDKISDWALDSVNFAYDKGIVLGIAPDTIDPMSFTSCEEGILLVYRTFMRYNKTEAPDITIAKTLYEDFLEIAEEKETALEIAEDILKNPAIMFSPAVMPVENAEYYPGFGNYVIEGYKEAVQFGPMIGTIPFMGYIFVLDENVDTSEFIGNLEANANLSWNICTTADEMVTGSVDNKVFFLMAPYGIEE